ncbi:MAG TPA: tetratricopeptide repeat protein [Isosphaeraceae bacterium]|jgi:tetratricopeptide (TPR) repeat protein|nr:tetratricopeptide repeat protein [Isosphaeraceae bacterium]
MALDPYALCPCGSGEKFKWCCQKVEALAERAQRLAENAQGEMAIQALEEGLRQHPDNPLLSLLKAKLLVGKERVEEALPIVQRLVARSPGNTAAQSLLIRILADSEGPEQAVIQFQKALGACPPEQRKPMAWVAQFLGATTSASGYYPSALAHLNLAKDLDPTVEHSAPQGQSLLQVIRQNAGLPPWFRNLHRLSPPPAGLDPKRQARFEQACQRAREGHWGPASGAFETLSAEGAGSVADRNLGLCRLWLTDHAGAAQALRRYVAKAGPTTDAIDLEALCQQIWPVAKDDVVERVQLIWPLRDRLAFLNTLRQADNVSFIGRAPINPDEENAPEVDYYALLDRPVLRRSSDLQVADIPRIVAHILLGQEIVALEAFDDERLGGVSERFTQMAGASIPPAHPRTKVLDTAVRASVPFQEEWLLPEGANPKERERLNLEKNRQLLLEVWPSIPQTYLAGRTPLQALQSGKDLDRTAVRGAVWRMEQTSRLAPDDRTFDQLRDKLGLEREPEVNPDGLDLDALPPTRLHLVPAERLADLTLVELYRSAKRALNTPASTRAARALSERPGLFHKLVEPSTVFADLTYDAIARDARDEAFATIQRGREAEPELRGKAAAFWDMVEIQARSAFEEPTSWVPHLAAVLDRYANDVAAGQVLLQFLIGMSLIQPVASPDGSDQITLDTRVLQGVLAQFAPRGAAGAGAAGASASRPGIWTPGSAAARGGGSAVWTPGSEPATGEKPKLIIPGR